ncbi:hypothetical protein GLAREA_08709 [Glarea lozoyensis ATCC 20868]|uniref:F-box domain-containing protein n=1 Tax=Glarea lozoyensis (strain ATCC 20868 / MF5171) TaxID=1116229 RepID=S3DX54_GLAL2|nr:uncharacterized protein GLAREA_08709 [Glarea lozoyensis ATCC 20868]EPE36546.1 hypothetical protein GLAREA_08709 [Glarea lozoyensis ATCC 20868]
MSSSVAQFASSVDLVYEVANQVTNRQSLRNCCLVSKNFNTSFTPLLYSEVWFRPNNRRFLLEDLPLLLNHQALQFVRALDVAVEILPDDPWSWDGTSEQIEVRRLCNEGVQSLLYKMPMLQIFRWAEMPPLTTTVSALQVQCPNIHSVVIHYHNHVEGCGLGHFEDLLEEGEDPKRPLKYRDAQNLFTIPSLSYFANLTRLEILRLHSDLNKARRGVLQILLKLPHLESMSLSICADAINRLEADRSTDHILFLVSLIEDFVQAGGKPLRLKKLILGLGVALWRKGHSLRALVDLTYLDEVMWKIGFGSLILMMTLL